MRAGFAVGLVVLVGVAACVGDASTQNGKTPGEEGGPCYGDGTCNKNQPLTCASNLCVRLGGDAGSDGSATNDGSTTTDGAGSDAPTSCDFPLAAVGAAIACGTSTCPKQCCNVGGTGTCQATDAQCAGGLPMQCDDAADCNGTGTPICCLNSASIIQQNTCPVKVGTSGVAKCVTNCTGITLCGKGEACPASKKCIQMEVDGVHVYGACF